MDIRVEPTYHLRVTHKELVLIGLALNGTLDEKHVRQARELNLALIDQRAKEAESALSLANAAREAVTDPGA
jgi:hypothetical protein